MKENVLIDPNWNEAPEWANWWAVDEDGDACLREDYGACDINLALGHYEALTSVIDLNGYDWK